MRKWIVQGVYALLAVAILERAILFIFDYNIRKNHADFDRRYNPDLIVGGKRYQLCEDEPVLYFYKYRTCFDSIHEVDPLKLAYYEFWGPHPKISLMTDEFAFSAIEVSRTLVVIRNNSIKKL